MPTDTSEFTEYYHAHFGHPVAQLYAVTGNMSEAQDCAQEAFVRAWPRWATVRRYDNPAAWLYRVGYPTREGVFSVSRKSRDHISSMNDMKMPYAMFFHGGQAVHYAEDSSITDSGCSSGSVIVLDRDAMAWLFDQVEVEDTVVIYQGRG
jgi:predicted RNA polymerase sigma factor